MASAASLAKNRENVFVVCVRRGDWLVRFSARACEHHKCQQRRKRQANPVAVHRLASLRERCEDLCDGRRERCVSLFDLLTVADVPGGIEQPGRTHHVSYGRFAGLAHLFCEIGEMRFEGNRQILGLERGHPHGTEVAARDEYLRSARCASSTAPESPALLRVSAAERGWCRPRLSG